MINFIGEILCRLSLETDYFVAVQEHRGEGDAALAGDDADSVDDTSEIHFVPQDKSARKFLI